MTAGVRVAAFGALLVALFALAALAGRALDPPAAADERDDASGSTAGEHAAGATSAHGQTGEPAGTLRLVAGDTTLTPRRAERFAFRIVDEHGETVRDFEVEQARRMHLIVVRRDLRRFEHLHPVQDAAGGWSTTITLPDAGTYHAFADFQTAGERRTLGTDLFAAGAFEPLALPAASTTATTGRHAVTLDDDGGELRFGVTRDGAPVDDLQSYLGAAGHLVMLRAGDLAYEHVHPLASRRLAFDTAGAKPGTYRLFLQFRHAGRVRTAAFTYAVSAP